MFNDFYKLKWTFASVNGKFFERSLWAVSSLTFFLISALHSASLVRANELHLGKYSACVVCNEPGKVYLCTYSTKAQSLDGGVSLPTINIKGLQFACIQEIAQYGGHGQCAYVRKSLADCKGEEYTLKNTAAVEQKRTPETNEGDHADVDEALKEKDTSQPTLVDETKKTYNSATKSVKKTIDNTSKTVQKTYDKTTDAVKDSVKSVGKGIGNAASTTYKCVTSFFQKCGE